MSFKIPTDAEIDAALLGDFRSSFTAQLTVDDRASLSFKKLEAQLLEINRTLRRPVPTDNAYAIYGSPQSVARAFSRQMLMFGGVNLLTDAALVERSEDWSGVRSPGRARRRRARGHAQRVNVNVKPSPKVLKMPNGDMVMHPATLAALKSALAEQQERMIERLTMNAILGEPYVPKDKP